MAQDYTLHKLLVHQLDMLLILLGLLAASTTDFGSGEEIMIVGLAPFGERHNYVGEGIKPAVQLALDDINRDEQVLPNHNLSISWIDTEVSGVEIPFR